MPPHVLSPFALCSLEDVKAYLGEDTADYDDLLTRLINAASEQMGDRSGREWVPYDAGAVTRRFPVGRTRLVRIGDARTVTAAVLEHEDGTVAHTLASGSWALLPRIRKPDRPYTRLKVHRTVPFYRSWVLAVTGTFGFPRVPDAVSQAAITQVMLWMARDVKNFSETFVVAEGRVVRPRELDPIVAAVCDSWRLDLLGGEGY